MQPTWPLSTGRRTFALAAGLACALLVRADGQPHSPIAAVEIESVDLSSIGPDSARAGIRLKAIAGSTAALRAVVFDEVTVNGVRVNIPPLRGTIRLREGEAVEGLPPLEATLMYRELESLEPLRRLVRSGMADVRARVRVQLELTLFQKLALMTGGAWVATELQQQVAVTLPGGQVGRLTALAALTAAEPVWVFGQNAQEWRRSRSELAARARQAAAGRLVDVESRYQVRSRQGETVTVSASSLGFSLGNGRVLVTGEAVEPWAFDASVSEAAQNGEIQLNESSLEILATPVGEGWRTHQPVSLRGKEIRIAKRLHDGETAISVAMKRPYRIRFRESERNAALLEVPAWRESSSTLPAAAGAAGDWQPAALVKIERRGETGEPVIWLTEARFAGGRYEIRDALDATAFGSPVWIGNGAAGMLQTERSAAAIETLMKKLL